MRCLALALGVMVGSALLLADDRSVTFDPKVDFATVKTFSIHPVTVNSSRPELSNALFARQIEDVVRDQLVARGLKESTDHPDVVVDASVVGVDYSIGPAGRANMIVPGRGGGPVGFQPVSFTEGTLVIDLTQPDASKLIWHGVYRRPKDDAPTLARKLPDGVKSLLSEFPPKKKK